MKRAWGYIGLGVCAYLVFVVALLPVERVYAWLKPSLGGTVLYDVKGSFWNGKAAAARVNGKLYRAVNWTMLPWSVVFGRLDAKVRFDNGDNWAKGQVGLTLGKKLRFADVTASMPAAEVRAMFPKILFDMGGTLALTLTKAEYDPQSRQLDDVNGELRWVDAALGSSKDMTLGTFKVALSSAANGVTGKLSDDGKGPLSAEGTLLLKPDNTYQVSGNLAARDASRSDLILVLRGIGQPDAQGRVKLAFNGSL